MTSQIHAHRSKSRWTMVTLALLAGTALVLAACSGSSAGAPAAGNPGGSSSTVVSFAKDVEPIFQSRCISCHGGQQTQRGLNLSSYASLMAGSVNGAVIVPGNPSASSLIQMVDEGKMPKRGPQLLPGQIQALTDWVKNGAPDN